MWSGGRTPGSGCARYSMARLSGALHAYEHLHQQLNEAPCVWFHSERFLTEIQSQRRNQVFWAARQNERCVAVRSVWPFDLPGSAPPSGRPSACRLRAFDFGPWVIEKYLFQFIDQAQQPPKIRQIFKIKQQNQRRLTTSRPGSAASAKLPTAGQSRRKR